MMGKQGRSDGAVPKRNEAMIVMCHAWQSVVDAYWKVVWDWITVKNEDRVKEMVRKEVREEEAKRLKKLVEAKRDEEDVGDVTKMKKKHPQNPKLVLTVIDLEEEDRDWEAMIIMVNKKMLLEKDIDIIEEASLHASGSKSSDKNWLEIFNPLGLMEADLDMLKQTARELQDLARVQIMSQLLTYCLFEASNKKIFGKDHLGEDKGLSGVIGNEDEADALGEETDGEYPDEILGWDDDVVKGQDLAPGIVKLSEELETGVKESGNESETESEKMTPKAKTAGSNLMELEELEETSGTTSGEEEGSDGKSDQVGNHLPTKGKESEKQVVKE
ncbi:hypothetical protein M422DRAFT_251661 [Sphaerobolus stellatus SS14]|uniref:Uncharacterized protein n=1 Tax=Sphaerobolus stellatus (strain SS14) TaxID=990650 RepID=A0A0C9VDB2_SPHS4|nr:hypothetical protein M422DRAFT_251661 [Sphaerobolus stellatus SS14]